MRRFWIGFLSATFAFSVVWNGFFAFFPRKIFGFDYAMWEAKHDLITLSKDPVDVVILGDSASISALLATNTRRSTLNLALPCSGPAEQYYLFDRYLKSRPAPKILVLSNAPPFFYNAECFKDFFLPYGLASIGERAEVLDRYAEIGQSLGLFGQDEALFDALSVPLRVRNAIYLGLSAVHLSPQQLAGASSFFNVSSWHGYDNDYRDAIGARGHYVYGEADRFASAATQDHGMIYDDFRPNPVTLSYVERILELAKRSGTKVLFRPIPLNQATTAAATPTFWSARDKFFREFSARHPEVRVVSDWRVLPPECFGDGYCHTNKRGAEIESAFLEEQIAEMSK